ncbi:MAG: type IV pilus secretin PilQ [Acidobacteria bacterium]|nr:type IV pilus secretin PilQ [Acidobacteriota bacterium]MBV9186128.1 type IV pilus secretin PilQ [Acidobacteriota bacterium]
MVNVRRKTRAKLILLLTGMLVAGVTSAQGAFWKRGAAAKAPAPAPSASTVSAGMSLTAIDVETSPSPRIILRTTASPVYTSYSPMPDLFVIDLTGASKDAALAIPSTVPPSVGSVSVDEVTEMGSRLTRVSVHLNQAGTIDASAEGNSIVINLPAVTAPAVAEVVPPAPKSADPAPVVTAPVELLHADPVPVHVEPEPVKNEPAAPVAEAPVVTESLPANKATTLKKIETNGAGSAIEVRLATDGDVAYNAFKLEKPSRIVIDLTGVNDKLAKNIINVSDPVVKRIRVSQFKSAPEAVTRVVLDVDEKASYHVTKSGDALNISFGASPAVIAAPVTMPAPAPKKEEPLVAAAPVIKTPAPKKDEPLVAVAPVIKTPAPPVKTAAATDIPSQVPTIADNAMWKMPEQRKPATSVINAPQTQTPPASKKRRGTAKAAAVTQADPPAVDPVPAGENVFTDPAPQPQPSTSSTGTMLSAAAGGRTLSAGEKVYTGEPLSLNLKDADIKDVLRTFAQLTGLNIAIDPTVTGSVTVDFVDVPWDQALEVILRQNSLAYVLEGNVMRVGTAARLSEEAESNRRLSEQERLNVALSTVGFKLSYARANDVASLLREMASPRARIIVDQRTNQLIISEIPGYLGTMRNLIDSVDVPTRQVVIEARIVETTKLFIQQYGFNWGFHGSMDPSLGTGTGLVFPNRIDTVGGPFTFGLGNPVLSFSLQNVLGTFTLDLALLAAETEGIARVISAPRVMTQDNTPAEIQSGFQIPYQTRVNFTTTVAYVDATLRLSVTPQITESGTVIMDIQVQKNEPATGLNIEGGSGTPLSTRRAQTRLMVRDGGTSVIAGIYQVKENNSQSRLPFVHQIPILGTLFRRRDYNSEHDELLIFITPRIVRAS